MSEKLSVKEILAKYKPDTRTAFDGSFAWSEEKVIAIDEEYATQFTPKQSIPQVTEEEIKAVYLIASRLPTNLKQMI